MGHVKKNPFALLRIFVRSGFLSAFIVILEKFYEGKFIQIFKFIH